VISQSQLLFCHSVGILSIETEFSRFILKTGIFGSKFHLVAIALKGRMNADYSSW